MHRYPKDCWRFYPDGLPALASYAGLRVVERHWDNGHAWPENAFWGDAFVVLQKDAGEPASVIAPAASVEAIARLEAAALAGLRPFALRRRLVSDALRRIRGALRTPIARLPRM